MRPEFVAALKKSISFSSKIYLINFVLAERGRAAFLIKNSSKRKRKAKEIEELKQEEEDLHKDKQEYLSKTKRIKEDYEK